MIICTRAGWSASAARAACRRSRPTRRSTCPYWMGTRPTRIRPRPRPNPPRSAVAARAVVTERVGAGDNPEVDISRYWITLIGAAAVLFPAPAALSASPVLEEWIAEALENNREVAAARESWTAAREDPAAARSLPDPMFGAELMRMDTRVDDFDMVKWMASQRVPWFGKRGARAAAAGLMAEAIGFRYLKARRNIRAAVTAAYWELWAASATVETYRENLDLLREFEVIARRRYAAGEGLLADLLRAEVETARLANDLDTRRRELEVAAAAVNRLLSQPEDTPRDPPVEPRLPELNWTLDEALAAARLYCCFLLSYRKEMEAAEEAVRTARLEWAPDFEFRVAVKQDRDGGDLRELDTGVGINIPWIWSGKYRAGERRARAELARAEARLDDRVDMLLLEVRRIYTRAETARQTVDLYREDLVPRAEELVESSRAAYQSGRTGFLELIEAQKVLLDTRLEDYRARARLASEIARLEAEIAPWDEAEIATGLME